MAYTEESDMRSSRKLNGVKMRSVFYVPEDMNLSKFRIDFKAFLQHQGIRVQTLQQVKAKKSRKDRERLEAEG